MTGNSSSWKGKAKAPKQGPHQVEESSSEGPSLQQLGNGHAQPPQPLRGTHRVEGSSSGGYDLHRPENGHRQSPRTPHGPHQVEGGSSEGHSLQQSRYMRVRLPQAQRGPQQVEASSSRLHTLLQSEKWRVQPPRTQGSRQHDTYAQRSQSLPQQGHGYDGPSRPLSRPLQGPPSKEPQEAWKCLHQWGRGGPSQGLWQGLGNTRSWQFGNQHQQQQQPPGSQQPVEPSSQNPKARSTPKQELLRKSNLHEEREQHILQDHANLVQFYTEPVDHDQHHNGQRRFEGHLQFLGHHLWRVEKGTAQVDGDPKVTAWKQFFRDWQNPGTLGHGSLTQDERQGLENVQKYFSEQQQLRRCWIEARIEIVKTFTHPQAYLEHLQFPTLFQWANEDILYRDLLEQVFLVKGSEARYPPQEPPAVQVVPKVSKVPLPQRSTQAGNSYVYDDDDDEFCYCFSNLYCSHHDPPEWNDPVEHLPDEGQSRA